MDRFQPGDRNQSSVPSQFQEAVVMPFNEKQIEEDIESFVDLEQPLWSAENYSSVLEKIPSLRELVKNPFLLKLSLDVLPRLIQPEQKDLAAAKVTRVALYDQFKRLVEKDLSEQQRRAFESLSDEGFAQQGIAFLKRLAADVYNKQGGNPVIEYSRVEGTGSWKNEYFSRDDHIRLLRDACPLTRSGDQYRFIHRSILEYGVARAVFEPQNGGTGLEKTEWLDTISKRRCSVDSAHSFDVEGALQDNAVSTGQVLDHESPLARRSFVSEPSVLQFLEERAQQEPVFKKQLHAYIHASKDDKKWRIAAANAITILVRAGEQFNSVDLQRIQIPGADLSFGTFDSAQLQGADLRKVKLSNVWLSKATLTDARMSGVEFEELPYLQEAGAVSRCVYSPDGNTLMTILEAGGASVSATMTWEKRWRIDRDVHIDSRIAFSPKSGLIASFITILSTLEREMEADSQLASKNETNAVYVWETETGHCCILRGHTAQITYSPRGDMIASCSEDKTIRLWNTTTNTCNRCLDLGDDEPAVSIAFSPKGDRIVSAHGTKQARLWDLETDAAFEPIVYRGSFMSANYSPAGTRIALCGIEFYSIWDVQSATTTKTNDFQMWLPGSKIMSLVYSPKGDKFATSRGTGGTVSVRDTETRNRSSFKSSDGCLDVAFSPKGDLIVTCGKGGIVQLWDAETGVCRGSMSGHSGVIRSVAFSPDGRHIASSGEDARVRLWEVEAGTTRANSSDLGHSLLSAGHCLWGNSIVSVNGGDTVHVWNTKTGACLQSMTQPIDRAQSTALSPGGDQIASGTAGSDIHLWGLKDVGSSSVLSGYQGAVKSLAYSPKGDQIASGSGSTVEIWDTAARHRRHVFPRYVGRTRAIAYSPTAEQFASISEHNHMIRLWEVEAGTFRKLEGHTSSIRSIAYSPTGLEIASASDDKTVRLWGTVFGIGRRILSGHEKAVNQALYSPEGGEIASCSGDCTVRLWNVETGICRLVLTCAAEPKSGVCGIAYSPAGKVLASADCYSKLQLWNVETGVCLNILQNNPEDNPRALLAIPSILFSPRDKLMAISLAYSSKEDKNRRLWSVRLWNVATGESRRTFEDLSAGGAPVFSPDGSRFACPETETTVRVWDVETEACHFTLGHDDVINDLKYSATGGLIATASEERTVKLWDANTGACLHTIQNHGTGVKSLAFSPKDRILLAGTDGSLRLWEFRSETLRRYLTGHEGTVNCVVFSPNKHLLASGSDDTTVCLWDLEAGSLWRVLEGHTASVQCVVFSPTGTHVVSGSRDKTIRLWDVEAGSFYKTMAGAGGEIWCLAYSPDGDLLASGTSNMSVYLWNVASGESWAVIEGTYGNITSLAWSIADNISYLITGCSDSSVRVWRVLQGEGKRCSVILQWSSSHRALLVVGCDLQGVKGLTEANRRLLMQGGALGAPEPRKSFKAVSSAVLATSRFQQYNQMAMRSEE
ncbi:hypothetical protein BGZ70_010676 [Mortierella alpina]|uniref:Uncharacterized protein n=1 Tax=Mortierella alpina TaxID=64518 RepID=A0A9P6J1X7_MORAP|nr:hypothetical protein BGZ70_010676 [Mortierella alpina]